MRSILAIFQRMLRIGPYSEVDLRCDSCQSSHITTLDGALQLCIVCLDCGRFSAHLKHQIGNVT